jgi:hypothetical protein
LVTGLEVKRWDQRHADVMIPVHSFKNGKYALKEIRKNSAKIIEGSRHIKKFRKVRES